MDNGKGQFEAITPEFFENMIQKGKEGKSNRLDKIFHVGEQINIESKSSKFIIRSIDHISGILTLKLLPEKRF